MVGGGGREGDGGAPRELVGPQGSLLGSRAGAGISGNPSLPPRLATPVAPRLFTTVITLVMT